MIILHIAPINMTRANGLRFSVPGLVTAQNKIKGISSGLMNVNNPNKLKTEEVNNFTFDFFKSFKKIKELPKPYSNPDIVVFHGVYMFKYIQTYKYLVKENIPYIIVPRVSLTDGAQKQKKLKKKIGNTLLFNKFVQKAAKIHYLTENERELSYQFKKDSFIVGNGTNLPIQIKDKTSQKINITFIGRYDLNHKGLDILVESLVNIRNELFSRGVNIRFFGSDFRGGKAYIENQTKQNGMESVLRVNDAVFGDEKHLILSETDIFIATSRFEGHPMAIIEAMAYGVPCILTGGTNMLDKLLEYDAGWSTMLDKNEIGKTILSALNNKDGIIEKGRNARRLVEENYTWDQVAKKTIGNYKNLVKTRR